VRSFPGGSAAGENLVRWDGTDNSAARAPAGTYTVRVEAARADGTKVDASQFVIGTVQGIEPNGSDLQLVVDGTSVPMSAVRNVSRPV
jgi:flagellar basal-body rod modification protein FlgD